MTVVVSSRAARSFIAATASAETWPALPTRNQNTDFHQRQSLSVSAIK